MAEIFRVAIEKEVIVLRIIQGRVVREQLCVLDFDEDCN